MRKTLILGVLLLAACAPETTPPIDISLQPYLTATPLPSATPNLLVIVETPLPTSTPFVYVVESGDTLSEIAEKFKISMDELRAANPDVSANSLSIGMTLIIPDPLHHRRFAQGMILLAIQEAGHVRPRGVENAKQK